MRARLRIDDGAVRVPLRIGNPDPPVRAEVSPPFIPVYPGEYGGTYTVTPTFSVQVLETAGKSMRNDVTVEEIPVHRVSNPAGGVTVSIGG